VHIRLHGWLFTHTFYGLPHTHTHCVYRTLHTHTVGFTCQFCCYAVGYVHGYVLVTVVTQLPVYVAVTVGWYHTFGWITFTHVYTFCRFGLRTFTVSHGCLRYYGCYGSHTHTFSHGYGLRLLVVTHVRCCLIYVYTVTGCYHTLRSPRLHLRVVVTYRFTLRLLHHTTFAFTRYRLVAFGYGYTRFARSRLVTHVYGYYRYTVALRLHTGCYGYTLVTVGLRCSHVLIPFTCVLRFTVYGYGLLRLRLRLVTFYTFTHGC